MWLRKGFCIFSSALFTLPASMGLVPPPILNLTFEVNFFVFSWVEVCGILCMCGMEKRRKMIAYFFVFDICNIFYRIE